MGKKWEDNTLGGMFFKKATAEPEIPEIEAPPPETEEIDLEAQKAYTKKRIKGRKGRSSTILGSANTGKKTVLG